VEGSFAHADGDALGVARKRAAGVRASLEEVPLGTGSQPGIGTVPHARSRTR
jgi:hypothetical protein